MSSSECLRGCMQSDVHFASCNGVTDTGGVCAGCAPEPTIEGLVVCGECRRRIRGLLRIAPDLLGRMRALAGHGKAVVYSPVKVFSAAASAPDQVDPDVADALLELGANLTAWHRLIDPTNLNGLDRVLADEDQTVRLAAAVIDRHDPDVDGGRHWSIADAAAKWGVERRDRGTFVYQEKADEIEELITPIHESRHDPLLPSKDAAARAGVTESQLRKWVAAEALVPAARLRDARGVVTRWYRASEVDHAADVMRTAAAQSRFKRVEARPA